MDAPPPEPVFAVPSLPVSGPVLSQDREPGLVETFSTCCLHLAQAIWRNVGAEASKWHSEKDRKTFQEALGQLVLWESVALNLDETLDAKEDLRTTILELLLGLGKLLSKWPHLSKRGQERRIELETLTTSIERAEFLVKGGESSGDEDLSLSESSEPEKDPNQDDSHPHNPSIRMRSSRIEAFLTYATCLMDLTPSAEDPVHEKGSEEQVAVPDETSHKISTSEAAQAFATKIRDIFPKADAEIVTKLATLNLQRSLRIIQVQVGESVAADGRLPIQRAASEKGPASVAPSSSFRDSGIGTSAGTISKYAPSLASVVSEVSASLLRVPPMPRRLDGYGRGFFCTLCGLKCYVNNRAGWKRHVFLDLGTYTCLRHPAEKNARLFPSRAALASHEFLVHRSKRKCSGCDKTIATQEEWESHIRQQHSSSDTATPTCTYLLASIPEEPCPLCHESSGSDELQYGTHLGQHLEQISLASIPRNLMVEEDVHDEGEKSEESNASDDGKDLEEDGLRFSIPKPQPNPSVKVHEATFQCHLCPKRFTRAYNLRSHLRIHTEERPFTCSVCGKGFARQHDRKRHEGLHGGEKKFVCKGLLGESSTWGCGRRFARADALGRHFRSEVGIQCIKALLNEEARERKEEARKKSEHLDGHMPADGFELPRALLQKYPALQLIDWSVMPGAEPFNWNPMQGAEPFDSSLEAGYLGSAEMGG